MRFVRFAAFFSGEGAAEVALVCGTRGRLCQQEGRGSARGSLKGSERLYTSQGEGFEGCVLSACGGCEVPSLPAAGGVPSVCRGSSCDGCCVGVKVKKGPMQGMKSAWRVRNKVRTPQWLPPKTWSGVVQACVPSCSAVGTGGPHGEKPHTNVDLFYTSRQGEKKEVSFSKKYLLSAQLWIEDT